MQTISFNRQCRVFWQLVKKELFLIRIGIIDKLVDGFITVTLQVMVFGYLMPLIGMPKAMIGPTFIGTVIQLFFSMGFGLSLRLVFDLEYARFINYYLTLPLNKSLLFAVYVTQFIVEVALTTIPLFSLGIVALRNNITLVAPNIPLFIVLYLLSLGLIATIFIAFSFIYSFRWFFDNIWPRRLTPLFLFSSVLFPWKKVYALSHPLGVLFLCNPFTYVAEGIRSTLIGGPDFLSPLICIPAIIGFTIASWIMFNKGLTSRLDPV